MLATDRLSIRPYHAGDEDFVAALAHEAFDEYTPYAVLHTVGMVRRCTTLVALREVGPQRRRVGFAAISDEQDGAIMLNAIAVVRSERGRGVGHFLMLAFERFGRVLGGRRLQLCTADYNLEALDLFLRHGFRMVRRRERFYDRGQDAVILTKDLR